MPVMRQQLIGRLARGMLSKRSPRSVLGSAMGLSRGGGGGIQRLPAGNAPRPMVKPGGLPQKRRRVMY